jgi:two-component system, OmpR family, sensor kinase
MRTPITTIYGNAQALQRIWNKIDDSDRTAALADIEHDAERFQRIIENMLVLARVEVGNQVAIEPVLLNRVMKSAVADLQKRYPSRRMELSLPDHVFPVVAQSTYLELVPRNLIGNAHKYSPLYQPLRVTVEPARDEVHVCVEDNGPGVPQEEASASLKPS